MGKSCIFSKMWSKIRKNHKGVNKSIVFIKDGSEVKQITWGQVQYFYQIEPITSKKFFLKHIKKIPKVPLSGH